MNKTSNSQSAKTRVATSLKIAAAVGVLSLIALTAEQSLLSAATASHPKSVATMAYFAGAGTAANDAMGGREVSVPTPAPSAADYFPANFPAPQGEAEPLPPTF